MSPTPLSPFPPSLRVQIGSVQSQVSLPPPIPDLLVCQVLSFFCFLVLFYCICFSLLFFTDTMAIILGLFFLSLGLFDLEGLSLLGLFSMRLVSLFLGMSTLLSVWWGIYLYRVGFDRSHLLSVLFSIYSPPPFTPHQGVSPSSRFTRHLLPTKDFPFVLPPAW